MQQPVNYKRVVFITTKGIDYIRNVQEVNWLKESNKNVEIIAGNSKNYLIRILQVYVQILKLKQKSYDEVFIGFSPQLILPIFYIKFRKKQITIDFFISIYDTFVDDRKKVKDGSILAKIMMSIDKYTLKKAHKIITDTKAHATYFCEVLGAERDKVQVKYLEANHLIYDPNKYPTYEDKRFTVLYFGSILPLQGIEVILKAIKMLESVDITFKIIGPVEEHLKQKYGTANTIFIPWLKEVDLAREIHNCNLCLAGHFNKDIGKARRTIPGKAYIYRAMNKPMILGENKATRELYNEKMEGIYFVSMGDEKALANLIKQIYKNAKA